MATELPVERDITIHQGTTWRMSLRWGSSDGTYYDLTGWTAALQVRRRPHATDIYLDLTTQNGGITLDEDGNISVVASAADTALIPRGNFRYDLELYQPAGDTIRLVMGQVTLSEEVTTP